MQISVPKRGDLNVEKEKQIKALRRSWTEVGEGMATKGVGGLKKRGDGTALLLKSDNKNLSTEVRIDV